MRANAFVGKMQNWLTGLASSQSVRGTKDLEFTL